MLFVSIAQLHLLQYLPDQLDGIELRLDLFPMLDLELLKNLMNNLPYPIMLTLKKKSHGGMFLGSEQEREDLIEKLLKFKPAFFDLEYDTRPDFIKRVCQKYKKTKFILSYHNFQETPQNLEEIYQHMSQHKTYGYKIAAMTHSTNDALNMLLFARNHSRLSVICMGEKGEFARILGPVVGNLINYASLVEGKETAPGQLPIQDLTDIYSYYRLNPRTQLYGLIGDPVSKSHGHIYHNEIFKKRRLNRLYVKMIVEPNELSTFLPLAKNLGFCGLSVTTPLKEKILPFIQSTDYTFRAINTLFFLKDHIYGTNTDGIGALNAIEKRKSVHGKKMVILGAGGTARAIAFEAHRRGAELTILNRTVQKAEQMALELGCKAGYLFDLPSKYDILINCTSELISVEPSRILPSAVIMDVIYAPRETPFLAIAKNLGCQVIYGDEMFLNQAAAQSRQWLKQTS